MMRKLLISHFYCRVLELVEAVFFAVNIVSAYVLWNCKEYVKEGREHYYEI